MSALETLQIDLHSKRRRDEGDPGYVSYKQGLANTTTFLRRLEAKRVRALVLMFDIEEVSKSETDFLAYLRDIRSELEDIVLKGHFPLLRSIVVDVGTTGEAIPMWTARMEACFPLIMQRGLLRVMEHILPLYVQKPPMNCNILIPSRNIPNRRL